MTTRLVIVPRWGGNPASDFYPWLAGLAAGGALAGIDAVERLAMPEPETPRIAAWTERVVESLRGATARTLLLGHSVGCQAVLRALASEGCGPVHATLLVAPWRTVDEPWPTLRPWIDEPFPHAQSRERAGRVRALVSDNDPFTSDWASTKQWLEADLGAEVTVIADARHFNAAEEPAVRAALATLV